MSLPLIEALAPGGKPRAEPAEKRPDAPGEASAAGQTPQEIAGAARAKPAEQASVPFWLAQSEMPDTRLRPDQPDRAVFLFAPAMQRVRVRLLYRRFWEEVTKAKKWPSTEISVVDQTFDRR